MQGRNLAIGGDRELEDRPSVALNVDKDSALFVLRHRPILVGMIVPDELGKAFPQAVDQPASHPAPKGAIWVGSELNGLT